MTPRTPVNKGRRIVQQLVLVFFLVVLWVMLWDSLTVLSVVTGIILAFLVTRVFYLPPVVLSGRFNILHAAVFAGWFLYSMVIASVEVAWFSFRPKAVGAGSVIAADLRTRSDLMMTLVADTASLIPGSIIVDSDRARGRLYLHVLDADTDEKILAAKKQVYDIEGLLIKALGSTRDLAALKVDPDPLAASAERGGTR
ncbi:Na+/H+ antiporter subunit E [Brevibacterium sanguinis]|uniref:Na+/H+ antiporter subunit E n=1 Tax=Brevibacterium TaxID=1696 RepID=UPI0010F78E82|nr:MULTISPECIES: Na+/H+ antiporter subunit E [unclassified Brevibacterium]MCM1011041.1 Na+/H+ antiporter subunit E [Brevibacterium sp. XM4083]